MRLAKFSEQCSVAAVTQANPNETVAAGILPYFRVLCFTQAEFNYVSALMTFSPQVIGQRNWQLVIYDKLHVDNKAARPSRRFGTIVDIHAVFSTT